MDILFALLFLLQRDECTPELQCSPESMQKIKSVFVSNKNRRVPIELVDISVKGIQRKIMFGCQENSWIDMSGAVLQDGIYTFVHEPAVVKGTHEIILWFKK
jgi:hypothetical protein